MFDFIDAAVFLLQLLHLIGTVWLSARTRRQTGKQVWVLGTGDKTLGRRMFEAGMFASFILWNAVILMHPLRTTHVFSPWLVEPRLSWLWLRLAGLALCVVAILLAWLAIRTLGKNWRIGFDVTSDIQLIHSGIYRWTRNPIMLSLLSYNLGLAMVYPNVLLVGILLFILVSVHLLVRKEESFLLARFGTAYQRYKQQVPRYLLF